MNHEVVKLNDYINQGIPTISLEELDSANVIIEPKLTCGADAEFTATGYINQELMDKLVCGDVGQSFDMTLKNPFSVQRRKHRKKRINKKWAKKYGYKTIFKSYILNGVSIVEKDYDM